MRTHLSDPGPVTLSERPFAYRQQRGAELPIGRLGYPSNPAVTIHQRPQQSSMEAQFLRLPAESRPIRHLNRESPNLPPIDNVRLPPLPPLELPVPHPVPRHSLERHRLSHPASTRPFSYPPSATSTPTPSSSRTPSPLAHRNPGRQYSPSGSPYPPHTKPAFTPPRQLSCPAPLAAPPSLQPGQRSLTYPSLMRETMSTSPISSPEGSPVPARQLSEALSDISLSGSGSSRPLPAPPLPISTLPTSPLDAPPPYSAEPPASTPKRQSEKSTLDSPASTSRQACTYQSSAKPGRQCAP